MVGRLEACVLEHVDFVRILALQESRSKHGKQLD